VSDSREGDSDRAWELVAEVANRYEAELMAGRLRAAGIEARVVDKSFRQEPVPTARFLAIVRVYVTADRLDEARQLVEEAVPPSGDAGAEEP
jgi:hypothetical protein